MELLDEKVQLWLDSARFVKAKSGVYVFYDKKFEVIYIGSSENLQKEFTNYIDTSFENNICKQKIYTYQRTFTENSKERKVQLLEEYKKKHGNFPCCNDDLVFETKN